MQDFLHIYVICADTARFFNILTFYTIFELCSQRTLTN